MLDEYAVKTQVSPGPEQTEYVAEIIAAVRAALERPRPALSAATIHEIIRRIQDALPRGEQSLVAPLYPTWEAATRIFDALRLYFAPPYAGAALPAPDSPTGDAVLDLLESAAKALRDVTVFTKGGGSLMRELLADCDRIAKKCELAVWSATQARREGDLEIGAGVAALPLTPTGVVTMSKPCISCGGCDYICADCGNTGAALPPQAGNLERTE